MRFLFFAALLLIRSFLLAQDYTILDYGAKADGVTLNTTQIQNAIDTAHKNGGGRIIIPAGRFLSGSLVLKSGVELHLLEGAVLLGSTDPAYYPGMDIFLEMDINRALVTADGQDRIAITGPGTMDGQGLELALHIDSLFYAGQIDSAFYNLPERRPQYYLRPHLIRFVRCKNIAVRNVTLKNASSWVQIYDLCENLRIDSVHVDSDVYWNNDGIDISDCKNVRITNCIINAADDGICLKSHSAKHSCDSIYIANCTVRSSASAIKFGTRSYGGFKNVVIENIKVYDTFRSAIAIECVDGGTIENILVDNVQATNTGNAIFIRLGKRNKTGCAAILKNVTIKNMKVQVPFERPDYAYEMRGPALPFFHNVFPSSITGIPGHAVENVILENIEIQYPGRGNKALAYVPLSRLHEVPEHEGAYPEFSMFGELPAWGFYVRHVDGLMMKNIKISIEAPDYRPAMVFDDVQNLDITAMHISGDDKPKRIVLRNTEDVKIEDEEGVMRMK